MLHGGLIDGLAFGRTLAHGGLERQGWVLTEKPLRLGWVLFVDAARPWDRPRPGRAPWQVDGGAGVRFAGVGAKDRLGIDVARGFGDGNVALSIEWEAR